MIQASELRNNTAFVWRNEPWRVLAYKHTHLARSSGDVRVKIRGLVSGVIKSQAFAPSERFEEALISKETLQFLYQEGDNLIFMNPTTFDQEAIKVAVVGETKARFLQEGQEVSVLFWEEKSIGVEIPPKVDIEVVTAEPAAKGNSATNIYKSAKLANGITTKVPLFINPGEKVRVDTETGAYVERAKGN